MFDLTSFDYIYIIVLLASTVWASMRGGVYETLTMVAWVIAALCARYISPYLNEMFQSWFNLPEPTIGTIVAAYFTVFFVILLMFSFVNQKLRDRIQDSFMKVTDHTFGIVFGILRGVVIMGFVYWGALWYYSENPLPNYVANASTRPIMQLTALKINEWFVPGTNALLAEDMSGEKSTQDIFENLINPAIQAIQEPGTRTPESILEPASENAGTGYRESERDSLENKLLQLDSLESE